MALCTVNGYPVIEGHISIPRVGTWHMDFLLDLGQPISSQATAVFVGGASFVGTVIRQAVYADYLRIRAVGGAAGLYKTWVQPKHWKFGPIPLSVPLKYILSQAGESLSPKADQGLLNTNLVSWTCLPQSGSAALRSLIHAYGDSWRHQPDGTVWVGTEAWTNVDGTFDYVITSKRTDIGVMELAEETSSLRPGTTFQGVRISRVDNVIQQNSFRTLAHYFETGSP